ncbi:polymeric immunoglobulin receptor-like [Austrofundulus limnaeus]|uniref:polymeric immunoglobulin receptor-like n=1 Tax=Austrofundulus limnaeus TaxID=52670 RepID=UPI0006B3B11E|nr:PREDICTED: polymeric immunoglobulin receptor-like [Austrofundulus limnaeus]
MFSGIYCQISTVTEVPVKAGGSISIPCLYNEQHKKNVKYLCKGKKWQSCEKVIDTSQATTGRYAIVDDRHQNIFNVTINELTDKDRTFWCAVEKLGMDVKQDFKLSVTSGSASLYVEQQEIAAVEKRSVTVICYYKNKKVIRWCRLSSTCVKEQLGQIDGTTVKLNSSVYGMFNVTMSELRTESSGWYYCATENLQMPVHVAVYESVMTTTVSTTTQSPSTTTFTGITESYTLSAHNI